MHNDSLVRGTIAMTMKIMRMMAQTVRVVLYISLSFANIQRTDIMALDDAAIPDPLSVTNLKLTRRIYQLKEFKLPADFVEKALSAIHGKRYGGFF